MIEFKSDKSKMWIEVLNGDEVVGEFHKDDLIENLPAMLSAYKGQCKIYTHNLHHELSEIVEEASGLSTFAFMKAKAQGFVVV